LTRLWQVSVRAQAEHEESVSVRLAECVGAPTVVYRDEDSGALTISAYPESAPSSRGELARLLNVPLRAIRIDPLRRENWAESWKRHFKPIEIGARLLIRPSWSRRRARPGQRVIILDPGLSFGTGHHATTEFCLRQLCRCRQDRVFHSMLDIGTGSGILAIAAAKLGFAPIAAFDVDPESIRVARQNLRQNNVARQIALHCADLSSFRPPGRRRQFDVICANLTYDLLAAEAGRIARLLSPSGRLIVAGILSSQFKIVTKSFQRFGLTFVQSTLKNNWRSGRLAFQSVCPAAKASEVRNDI